MGFWSTFTLQLAGTNVWKWPCPRWWKRCQKRRFQATYEVWSLRSAATTRMAKMLKFPSFNTDFHVVPSEQLFESVITSTTKISCDLKKRIQVDSVSQLLYDYFNTVCSINFFSFGVLFKCIPWQTLAKILFESLVHCEYKNTKPNIEIKQSKLLYSVSNFLLQKMPWWMLGLNRCFLAWPY